MDTYMHTTMASVVSLEKFEIIRSQEFMLSKAKIFEKKKEIVLGPKTAILGHQFCRILVLGPHFWWSGGRPRPPGPPGSDSAFSIKSFFSNTSTSHENATELLPYYTTISCFGQKCNTDAPFRMYAHI